MKIRPPEKRLLLLNEYTTNRLFRQCRAGGRPGKIGRNEKNRTVLHVQTIRRIVLCLKACVCRIDQNISFLELQEELRSQLTRDAENAQRIFSSPMERMQTSRSGDAQQGLHLKYSRLMMQNLDSVFHKNTEETLEQVVQLLSNCTHKYIVGQRPTASLAERFAFLLRMTVPGVMASTQRVIMEDILDICPEDCLFVIDFNQYSNTAMKVLSYGQSRGAKIVLLTDRPTAPFACPRPPRRSAAASSWTAKSC